MEVGCQTLPNYCKSDLPSLRFDRNDAVGTNNFQETSVNGKEYMQ